MKEEINALVQQVRYSVLQQLLEAGYKEKLWLKRKLEEDEIQQGLSFYPAENNQKEILEALGTLFEKEMCPKGNLPFSVETKNRIFIETERAKYRIPFFLEVNPYKETSLYPVEEVWGELKYYRFPTEEYLAQGFYEILDKLELLNDLSGYKEIYEILSKEAVEGRRVRDSFAKLLEKKKIPSLEKRLDTLKSYENYSYMKKKWKSEKKRHVEELPEWNQVITLLVTFFSPIFYAVIKDEIFFDDWMPQLGRYL